MKNSINANYTYILNGRTTLYDKLGNIKSDYISYKAMLNSEMHKVSEYFYNEDGNLKQEVFYNEKYVIFEEKHFNKDGTLDFKLLMDYNENGLLIEKNMILASGNQHGKWIIKYDELNRIKKETWLNKDGKVEAMDIYIYSKDRRKTWKRRNNLAEWIYTYDANARLIKSEGGYFSNDEYFSVDYGYGSNNLLKSESSYYLDGQIKRKTTYLLDSQK